MILMIDNYDSFTYNLVQYMGEIIMKISPEADVYSEIRVFRNDKITVSEIQEMKPDKIVISPGPELHSRATATTLPPGAFTVAPPTNPSIPATLSICAL